eukprot:CAMPEP_0117596066 /NCGR_PEP_ID=MMETSP0784-20121206/74102_1 /TAXON_ID=39447 /ORGANISM="" /LENGTH=210 /DNA_ID=CAMNT_0005398299 /DNA_START=237 /DNA_END=867 /DNA_ORIENTATION=+
MQDVAAPAQDGIFAYAFEPVRARAALPLVVQDGTDRGQATVSVTRYLRKYTGSRELQQLLGRDSTAQLLVDARYEKRNVVRRRITMLFSVDARCTGCGVDLFFGVKVGTFPHVAAYAIDAASFTSSLSPESEGGLPDGQNRRPIGSHRAAFFDWDFDTSPSLAERRNPLVSSSTMSTNVFFTVAANLMQLMESGLVRCRCPSRCVDDGVR